MLEPWPVATLPSRAARARRAPHPTNRDRGGTRHRPGLVVLRPCLIVSREISVTAFRLVYATGTSSNWQSAGGFR